MEPVRHFLNKAQADLGGNPDSNDANRHRAVNFYCTPLQVSHETPIKSNMIILFQLTLSCEYRALSVLSSVALPSWSCNVISYVF